jgi:hypothetical protein
VKPSTPEIQTTPTVILPKITRKSSFELLKIDHNNISRKFLGIELIRLRIKRRRNLEKKCRYKKSNKVRPNCRSIATVK